MPLMNFTKLIKKVLDKSKTMTTRNPRKRPLKKGDTLHVWVRFKIGKATVTDINMKKIKDFTTEEAINDGFNSVEEYQKCIMELNNAHPQDLFTQISYNPHWEKTYLITESELEKLIKKRSEI